ncbi:MAG: class I SAM-dependent RNA methyltransferase [Nitrospirota bacterium]
MNKSVIFVSCAKGMQSFVADEIRSSGFAIIDENMTGIVTEGNLADTMTLNLFLRTGQRILYLLSEFNAETADELYRELSRITWEDYIHEDGYVSVTSTVNTPAITDSRYANLKCKDAIVDRIKNRSGRRPDSGPEKDSIVVHLHWKDQRCAVYLDTSGEPLSKRGYRKIPLRAPLQETLAAALVLATGWNGRGNFINPMCGSGTIAIEAALIALNRVPGLLRNNYAFMHLKGFDNSLWKQLRERAKALAGKSLDSRIIASDISPGAIETARKNAQTAGVEHLIDFMCCDYSETTVPAGGGVVMLNPEYGERMGRIIELENTYKGIGDFFKHKCKGYTGYIFTGNPGLAKRVGLRSKRRIQFYNGSIECRLIEYELYEGSRKRG